jgi:acyl-CoA thioester hydrolase
MSRPRRLVHTETLAIRWGGMDALRHVNNTVYFQYMEQARVRFMESARLFGRDNPGQGGVIVNASCNFRKALVYPATVEVRMYLGEPGRSSIESFYDLLCGGELYADGTAKIVWIDLATQRAIRLPERLRDLAAARAVDPIGEAGNP